MPKHINVDIERKFALILIISMKYIFYVQDNEYSDPLSVQLWRESRDYKHAKRNKNHNISFQFYFLNVC